MEKLQSVGNLGTIGKMSMSVEFRWRVSDTTKKSGVSLSPELLIVRSFIMSAQSVGQEEMMKYVYLMLGESHITSILCYARA